MIEKKRRRIIWKVVANWVSNNIIATITIIATSETKTLPERNDKQSEI